MGISPDLRVGKRTDGAGTVEEDYAYGSFDLVEMQLYNQSIRGADRQKIEGYLAWKYNLQSNLPDGHPYKNTPPV